MSMRVDFSGDYEERERKIKEAIAAVQKIDAQAKIRYSNPKNFFDYVIRGLLDGIEEALYNTGRETAHRLVDYFFDTVSKQKKESGKSS
jgi:hypothetical protein